MRDPNDIDLSSVDPDLSVNDDSLGHGAASDLMDYAQQVGQWGEDSADFIGAGPAEQKFPRRATPAGCQPYFHPRHRMQTPFMVAGLVAVLILVVVFIPMGKG